MLSKSYEYHYMVDFSIKETHITAPPLQNE